LNLLVKSEKALGFEEKGPGHRLQPLDLKKRALGGCLGSLCLGPALVMAPASFWALTGLVVRGLTFGPVGTHVDVALHVCPSLSVGFCVTKIIRK